MIPHRKLEMQKDPLNKNPAYRSCNVCSNTLTPRFRKVCDPITNKSFSILACTKCGLGHTHPQPDDLNPYYGRGYYGGRHSITAKFCIKRRLRFLEHIAGNTAKKRLLDMGCGDGSFLLAAKEVGWDVTGTEINPQPARAFGLDISHNLDQIEGTGQFDCITMWHSLEHMKDIKSTLHSIAEMLAPKGHLIIAVPNNGSLQARLFGSGWLPLDVPRHLYHFDPGSLHFSLKDAGFIVRGCRYHETEYDLIGWSQSAMNYLNPTPNVFFDVLTGKGKGHSAWAKTSNLILGSILIMVFTPALVVEAVRSRSGTVVMVACKSG